MEESKIIQRAKELRNGAMCPNCAETILMSYAEKLGLSESQAAKFATNFGSGMKSGSTCGVVTSSMMILGMLGVTDPRVIGEFQRRIKENHNGLINCKDLLKANAEAGGQKKTHCDAMIMEAMKMLEEYVE